MPEVPSTPVLAAFRRRFVRNPEVNELTPFGFFEAGWKAVSEVTRPDPTPIDTADHLSCSHPEVHVDTLWQDNKRLRVELDKCLKALAIADVLVARSESARARLVQTEAVVQAGIRLSTALTLHEPTDQLRYAFNTALRAIPEAPPAQNKVCLCLYAIEQVAGKPIKHDSRCPWAPPVTAGSD